jgi:ERCC4-type nuclease
MTDLQVKDILKNITIICDTRENMTDHITGYFASKGIKYIDRKLDYGDYSFICPPIPHIKLLEPFSFEKRLVIERKSGLEELSGNLAQARERFEREFERAQADKAKMILMVEGGSWNSIIEHKYKTNLNEKSFMASLFTYMHRYDVTPQFVPEKYAGMFIYSQFYYFLRQELKQYEQA